MLERFLQVAIKAAFPNGLKIKFASAAGKVLILTSTDQVIRQMTFSELEQLINSNLGSTQT